MPPRRVKICATLGPASSGRATVESLVKAGLDVARLNFSHGNLEEHRAHVTRIRRAAKKAGRPVAILQDLQGPKLRLGRFEGEHELTAGQKVVLTLRSREADPARLVFPSDYRVLPREVSRGSRIVLGDGLVRLEVLSTSEAQVRARVLEGGLVTERIGMALPGAAPRRRAGLTAKDRRDLEAGLEMGVDLVAVSYLRSARDLQVVRRFLARRGAARPWLVGKVETATAVSVLDEIVEASDGIIVARGDLGVEHPIEQVPLLQKRIIERSRAAGRPVMVATQMLESMRWARRPTRAEASDVANAVFDGADSLLLSAETAAGDHPVRALSTLDRLVRAAEGAGRTPSDIRRDARSRTSRVTDAVAEAAVQAAAEVGARALVTVTRSGATALMVARYRPSTPLLAFTPEEEVRRRLSLAWGVRPLLHPLQPSADRLLSALDRRLRRDGLARSGERVVVLVSHPLGGKSEVNLMKVHTVG
jgi:pyruvate kinase